MQKVVLLVLALCAMYASAAITVTPITKHTPIKADWECSGCVDFMDQAINQLINIIANVGVLGGCGTVCSYLNAQWEVEICNVICDIVGIMEFANLINSADPDPLWICMEVTLCPYNDKASGSIKSLTVNPTSGRTGTTFNIELIYQITNTTGVGEVVIEVDPSDGSEPLDMGELIIAQPPGLYKVVGQLQTQPTEDDPFNPGMYKVIGAVCEGSCGGTHSHTFIIAEAATSLRITQ